jgi:hypothetical protein
MTKRSSLRASDADRDRVAERLHQAVAEGRLLAHEFEERLGRTLRARTYGELDAIVDDLPGTPIGVPVAAAPPVRLQLLRRYPMAFAALACVMGVAVAGFIAAAILFATSGLWILPVVAFFVFRGKGRRSRGARRGDGLGHMHMHARRYGRF